MKPATRLIIEDALEAASRDALGRDYYEHGRQTARAGATGFGWDVKKSLCANTALLGLDLRNWVQ